jgi:antitoxin component YwqK of YwqJK toxin-antitoxin module
MRIGVWTRNFFGTIIFLSLIPMVIYAQVKEYTINVDAVWDNVTETMQDANGKLLTGIVKSYNESGKVVTAAAYKNGKKDGISTRYVHRGDETLKIEYSYKNGKLDGFIRQYDRDGELSSETPYKDGFAEGVARLYYKGKLAGECIYVKGKMHGLAKEYYGSGAISSEGFVKNGEMDGLRKSYYESGAIRAEIFYKNGLEEGMDKKYNKDETLNHEINMKGGKKEGTAKYYYKNGKILEVQYKDDTAESAFCVDNNGLRAPLAVIARDAEQSEATRGNLPDSNRGVLPPRFNPSLHDVCEQL